VQVCETVVFMQDWLEKVKATAHPDAGKSTAELDGFEEETLLGSDISEEIKLASGNVVMG
jgi:hypothetical protein